MNVLSSDKLCFEGLYIRMIYDATTFSYSLPKMWAHLMKQFEVMTSNVNFYTIVHIFVIYFTLWVVKLQKKSKMDLC